MYVCVLKYSMCTDVYVRMWMSMHVCVCMCMSMYVYVYLAMCTYLCK